MASDMAQSLRSSRSSFGSSNEFDTLSNNSFAISNGDDYNSDGSNFAPPTPNTLSAAMPLELSGAIPLIDKFQVKGFLRAMQKQKPMDYIDLFYIHRIDTTVPLRKPSLGFEFHLPLYQNYNMAGVTTGNVGYLENAIHDMTKTKLWRQQKPYRRIYISL